MRLTLTSFAAGLAVLLLGSTVQADPYQPYAGTNLVVNFPVHPHYDAVLKVLPEFTKETGITVEVDQLEYLKMRERQALELTKPVGDYDLIAYVVFSKAYYVYAEQLENLAKYFMSPRLVDPTYDAADLIPGYVQNIGMAGVTKVISPGRQPRCSASPSARKPRYWPTAGTFSRSTGSRCQSTMTSWSIWRAAFHNWSPAWAA